MTKKQRAAIYRAAARNIEGSNGGYSCIAIFNAKGNAKLAADYVDTFVYGLKDPHREWGLDESRLQILGFKYAAIETGVDEADIRILALCLMATLVESGVRLGGQR